ncbi:twin-arginine translocase TatA/TatE family subunit [Candidatus Aminicenantes bacterium AC-335-A11]|jgi:sec-independent protein translocase protein TatA|nr:twin-arginine translocase TatA/TatE family subunit [SCandidatus Aminicenantes bacterium Aminicenantia_JdfR_composite]MCP2598449.1 twin-arginine translocase TatA/TatE family subunit [Candidatus Aminicenantes bacterium AC-335-L06]MCP2618570.1 twin-arginine translocase TatA/TatE family subunit [Candidatus Aminicenantes bacterium AC-335-A11]
MFGSIGPTEILLVLLIIVIIFGAKRLPELGRAMGEGIKNFKRSLSSKEEKKETEKNEKKEE